MRALLLGSVGLMVFGVGLLAWAWELRRRYPETEVAA